MLLTERGREDREIINSLAVIIKTTHIHQPDNIAVVNAIKKFFSVLSPLLTEKSVKFELIGEFFYLDSNRIKYSVDSVLNYDFLVREFKKRELGSIIFEDNLQEKDIRTFLTALISTDSGSSFETLYTALEEIESITIEKLKKTGQGESKLSRKKAIKKTYFSAVFLTKEIATKIKSGEKVNLKKTKRVMETIIDQLIEEEQTLIGMTTIKDYDEYTYNHSVNVSIFSLVLGHKLGLSRKVLSELGLAALLHDIGKIEVPKEILNKPTEFTEEEWVIMRKHPVWGAWAVLKIKGIDTFSMCAAISAFEHHLNYNLSGYPKIKNERRLSLFSRIISIADQYDAMTSSRVYSRIPVPPDKALSMMLDRSGTQLDPHLLDVFINVVGIYPIGSLVMLDTNELGMVFENNPDPDFINRPRVLLIVDTKGEKINMTVDLMEKDQDGNFTRNIIKTLDPNQYGINLAEYLL